MDKPHSELGYLDYVRIGREIPHSKVWEDIVNEWVQVMNDYAGRSEPMNDHTRNRRGDLAYWHQKEETNLGFLVGAVWRLGAIALREFEVTRPGGKPGAGDLWIRLGDLSCHIEAKGTDRSSVSRESVDQMLAVAEQQLAIPDDEKADAGLALCFVVPAVVGTSYDFRGLVRQFEGNRSLVAVYLSSRRGIETAYEGYNYPGVAIVGRLIWSKAQGN